MAITDELTTLAEKNKVQPITNAFDEDRGVAGRVNSLTSSGSPLFETARTKAAQNSAKRGLMNSSIGVQAGEQAVIETATPIASADASLYQQQQLANQQARNNAAVVNSNNTIQAGTAGRQMDLSNEQQGRSLFEQARQFDAGLSQRANEFGVTSAQTQQQIDAQKDQFAQQQAEQQRQFDATTAQREVLARMDVDSRRELAEIEARFKNEIQSSANISNAWGSMLETIAQIQNNPNLDNAAKEAMIQNNLSSFQAFSTFWGKATGGAVDVSDLLNFGMAGLPPGAAPPPQYQPPAPVPPPVWQESGTGGGGAGSGDGGGSGGE